MNELKRQLDQQKNAPELPIGRFLKSKSIDGNRLGPSAADSDTFAIRTEDVVMMTKGRWNQISIRGLLTCSVVVALGLLVYLERSKRMSAERQLSEVLPEPRLQIDTPSPLRDEYWTQGTFGVAGQLTLPVGYVFRQPPTLEVKLFNPTSGKPVWQFNDTLASSGTKRRFNCEMKCEGVATPGLFPVSVAVLDGGKVVAHAVTVMRFVDI